MKSPQTSTAVNAMKPVAASGGSIVANFDVLDDGEDAASRCFGSFTSFPPSPHPRMSGSPQERTVHGLSANPVLLRFAKQKRPRKILRD
jgi:hypothetical protein